jgi:hypothetical protein
LRAWVRCIRAADLAADTRRSYSSSAVSCYSSGTASTTGELKNALLLHYADLPGC